MQIVNQSLLAMVKDAANSHAKRAFVPAGDPAMDPSAGGGAPPGGAPPGGAPGMDPSMMDPAMAGGGAPPPPPAPPAPAPSVIAPSMQGGEPIKPKIDINVTMLQILKILARLADALGVPIPASEMVATQGDLTQMATQQGGGGGGGGSAIPPIAPIQGAGPGMEQQASDRFSTMHDKAAAVRRVRRAISASRQ